MKVSKEVELQLGVHLQKEMFLAYSSWDLYEWNKLLSH